MLETVRKLMLVTPALLLATQVFAQEEPPEAGQAAQRRYAVEFVIFTYAEDVATGTEIFPADAPAAVAQDPELIEELGVSRLQRRQLDFVGLRPELLREDQFTMQKVVEQLELLDVYQPVLHGGWIQPGYPQSDAVLMHLAAFGELPPGLDGSFTMYLGRYLHLVVDLALTAPGASLEYEDESGVVRAFEYEVPLAAEPVRYRIQEDRIVRSGEIRYFDHPKFGVVAKVLRVDDATDDGNTQLRPPLLGQAP